MLSESGHSIRPIKIVTVLKSGGDFRREHVVRLQKQINGYLDNFEFVELNDSNLIHGWPGWWSKIEAFRIRGPVLYFDLDTTVRDDIRPLADIARSHHFVALREFNRLDQIGSGVMAWRGDMSRLYRLFASNPDRFMAENDVREHWGDQGFINSHQRKRAYWQDLLPGAIKSFKLEYLHGDRRGTRVIAFHGKPRPWECGF